MSSVGDASERQPGVDDELLTPDASSYVGWWNLHALVDVVFGGAALALLLMWLVLAIAGGRLS